MKILKARWIILLTWLLVLPAFAKEDQGIELNSGAWSFDVSGYLKTAYIYVQQPSQSGLNFIGENNGFTLLDGRIAFLSRYRNHLESKIQIDATGDHRSDPNQTVGTQYFELKDAWVAYRPTVPYWGVMVGQFKPPVEVESMLSTTEMVMIRRSVVSNGVQAGEGRQSYGSEGLGTHREVGIQWFSKIIPLAGPLGLRYQLAVTNGNSASHTRNDNNDLAYYGRLEFHIDASVLGGSEDDLGMIIGAAGGYNVQTPQQFPSPDLLTQEDLTYEVDLRFQAYGLDILGQFIQRQRHFPDLGQDDQITRGIVGRAAYQLPFENYAFQFAYRFALLDPFVDQTDALSTDDQLIYHTLGIAYPILDFPAVVKVNYTHTQEEGRSEMDNDIVEGLVQMVW